MQIRPRRHQPERLVPAVCREVLAVPCILRGALTARRPLFPCRGDSEFVDAAQDIARGRVGPMQVFEGKHDGLNAPPAITQLVNAASCPRRNSSGGKVVACSADSGMSRSGVLVLLP
jgi:hypothetical protein